MSSSTAQPPSRPAAPSTELGPMLGRLFMPPDPSAPVERLLGPVRLGLLTGIFERTGWLSNWEKAVAAAEQGVSAEIERRLREAAAISRYPARRLSAELPAADDRRVLQARLSAAGIGFEEAVARLEAGLGTAFEAERVRLACGELQASWSRLIETAGAELARWDVRAAAIRSWRRPWWPLATATGLVLAGAIWLGLVLGGYLDVPGWLRPFAEWVWSW
ncbi:MAG: hypothetical protein ACT4PM_12925 [Gemmatimonadales bacterium]